MRRQRRPSLVLPGCLAVVMLASSACNCGSSPKITHVPEDFSVVPGNPSVDPDQPTVAVENQPPPVQYNLNVPRQCDLFVQNTVRKTDILWVIQNSGSMAPHQAQLAQNFTSFVQFLLSADPPIDFHIAVTTTDTDDTNTDHPTQGRLSKWTNGASSGSYIACDQNHLCNTQPAGGDPTTSVEDAFTQMSKVGTFGSAHQRGLYATYEALNNPDNIDTGSGQGFIRPDAALYVVFVGSEDDLSCAPTLNSPPPAGSSCRTVDYECACSDDGQLTFGTTEFYERFLENYKGYGHSDLVAAAAVVAVDQVQVPNEFNSDSSIRYIGCSNHDPQTNRTLVAYYGQRYIEVANATGGAATSICAANFNDALTRLGFAVSGLRRDFKLSRGPTSQSIETYISKKDSPTCQHDSDCATAAPYSSCQAGRCAELITTSLQPTQGGAQYIRCDNGVIRNIVEFGTSVIPPAQGTVEVCYDVDAHFSTVCQ